MKKILYLLMAVILIILTTKYLLYAWEEHRYKILDEEYTAQREIYEAWDEAQYFPDNALDEWDSHSFSYFLAGLAEPIIYNQHLNSDTEIIRFIYYPSFSGPFVARITATPDYYIAELKLGILNGYYSIEGVEEVLFQLDAETYLAIREQVQMIEACMDSEQTTRGFDGSVWVVEIRTADSYCVASIWTPKSGPWNELAVTLTALSRSQGLVLDYFEFDQETTNLQESN